MNTNILKLRIVKPCCVRGERVEIGEVVVLDALDAAGLLASGRGVALDPDAAKAALDAANERVMREAGPPPGAPRELPWVLRRLN